MGWWVGGGVGARANVHGRAGNKTRASASIAASRLNASLRRDLHMWAMVQGLFAYRRLARLALHGKSCLRARYSCEGLGPCFRAPPHWRLARSALRGQGRRGQGLRGASCLRRAPLGNFLLALVEAQDSIAASSHSFSARTSGVSAYTSNISPMPIGRQLARVTVEAASLPAASEPRPARRMWLQGEQWRSQRRTVVVAKGEQWWSQSGRLVVSA